MSNTTPNETTNTAPNTAPTDPNNRATLAAAYWRAHIRVLLSLLVVWFIVSFGFGIIAVDELNKIQFYGFKLGFWWAQQGSIYVFVVLIFVYAWLMHRIDRKYGVSDRPQHGED
jgi:putative solute:sodium symporter small subunit